MRVLVTGGSGNLGKALQRSVSNEFLPVGRADWAQLPKMLDSGLDAVLHAAWDLRSSLAERPEELFDSNVMTTARLLEACRTHGVRKFAFMSTCAVYGESTDTAEDTACCPVTVNGITKLLNERLVEAFCAEHGIECQIYRVFNMFGGNDHFSVLSHLRRALDRGTPFVLNNGGVAKRDFVHVDDVARILSKLLKEKLPAIHVNIGTGRATRISDIVEVVQRLRPDLRISGQSIYEAEFSQADITLLTSIVGELSFIDVLRFVEETFGNRESGATSTAADRNG